MNDRGMKKWQPFKALTEQDEMLLEMQKKKNKIERPILCSDKIEEINMVMKYELNNEVIASYFDDGEIKEVRGELKKVDPDNHILIVGTKRICYEDLVDLEV